MEAEATKVDGNYGRFATKTVPRWLRMSLRIAILVGLVSAIALSAKEIEGAKFKAINIVFLALGSCVLAIWEPLLGKVVLAFTLIIPVGLVGVWLAYGLFLGCPDIIFMMGACVCITFIVFFFAELLSLPVAMLSVLVTIFIAASSLFVQMPPMAYTAALLLTVILPLSAVVATVVCWLVFPEFCVDEVFSHHHEMLEHLLHLAHYSLASKPPRLVKRVATSAAATFLRGSKYKRLLASASEEHSSLSMSGGVSISGGPQSSGSVLSAASSESLDGAAASIRMTADVLGLEGKEAVAFHKLDRCWVRVMLACQAAGAAQVGAKAEVVLMAAAHKRIIVPCCPLLPCARGQLDEAALLALRHVSLNTALQLQKIFNATHPLDDATHSLLQQLLTSSQWRGMCSSLLACLQEVVDTFPFDYYPQQDPTSRHHLVAFQESIHSLLAAWEANKGQLSPVDSKGGGGSRGASTTTAAAGDDVVIAPDAVAAAAAAAAGQDAAEVRVLRDPLLLPDSPAALQLARLHVLLIVELLQELGQVLEQLYNVADLAAASILRWKCC